LIYFGFFYHENTNQLRNKAILPLGRMDCYRRACHNRRSWSIQGGSAFQSHSSNPGRKNQ